MGKIATGVVGLDEISRSLLILKSRGGKHSNRYPRFVITAMAQRALLSEPCSRFLTARSHAEMEEHKGGEEE